VRDLPQPLARDRQARRHRRPSASSRPSRSVSPAQLTMRTFHTGGVASADDITRGLPRRHRAVPGSHPKGASPPSQAAGRITIEDTDRSRRLILTPTTVTSRSPTGAQALPSSSRTAQHVELGQQLHVGAIDPKEFFGFVVSALCRSTSSAGFRASTARRCADPRQAHRVIVRQMLRKVTVVDHGDTGLLPELVDRLRSLAGGSIAPRSPRAKRRVRSPGRSWVSPRHPSRRGRGCRRASFQGDHACSHAGRHGGQVRLMGLKENVIIEAVPAGTGHLPRYRNVSVEATDRSQSRALPTASSRMTRRFGGGPLVRRLRQLLVGRLHPRNVQLSSTTRWPLLRRGAIRQILHAIAPIAGLCRGSESRV
jgi:DNA-directed RNA polymerase subunit beta'